MTDDEYLAHIESAILEIRIHTAGMNQKSYEADSKTQRAVERNLQIVGDAAHKLSARLKEAHVDIPWDDVYAARNMVVHHAGRPRPAPGEGPGTPRPRPLDSV